MYDVVIVGGGPAGLSAALVLGRCRRKVLLCDDGHPRNAASRALHGYLTRDGVAPLELVRLGREELCRYGIEHRQTTVKDVVPASPGFALMLDGTGQVHARTVLLATGMRDHLPEVPGIRECYGITVHHCPYCDGWEVRDKKLVVIGQGTPAAGLALALKTWSDEVSICTNGKPRIGSRARAQLADHGIAIVDAPIERLDHDEGHAQAVVLASGRSVPCEAVFFSGSQTQQCDLPRQLGCEMTSKGVVKTDHLGQTCVPGLYVVGDASRDVQFAVVAAAEGAKAGVAINKALQARAGLAVAPEAAAADNKANAHG